MNARFDASAPWQRRAQPLLGTLVEVGVQGSGDDARAALDAAFAAVREVQACLSRFEADSDLARFHALRRGESMPMRAATRQVLAAAHALQAVTDGAFDISLGTAPDGWHCDGDSLHKASDSVRLDLGGIGKGHAVDRAVAALIAQGCAAGWVNAGGDLRAFGDAELPIRLRDEAAAACALSPRCATARSRPAISIAAADRNSRLVQAARVSALTSASPHHCACGPTHSRK